VDEIGERLDSLQMMTGGFTRAFKAIVRASDVPDDFRRAFLAYWISFGEGMRSDSDSDLVLMSALWKLLPTYSGPALTLFRGDSAYNRKRRTYGLSWTSSEEVARDFAQGIWRTFKGGSVVLKCTAPPGAIICMPALDVDDRYGETEYLVDRRKIMCVEVVQRFAQISRASARR
jgi:hypothetical protein